MIEFNIGDIVTLDRYNHIDDVQKVKVVGYGKTPVGGVLTYKMRVDGVTIESTGVSIMESRFYEPAPPEERQCRRSASVQEREEYWDNKLKIKSCQ